MNYDVLIERNVLKEIKKFPAHDVDRIKKRQVWRCCRSETWALGMCSGWCGHDRVNIWHNWSGYQPEFLYSANLNFILSTT